MGKATRVKRRAAIASARRSRGPVGWYVVTGVVIVSGVVAVALSRGGDDELGPVIGRDHWHTSLGVYLCDHWEGEASWAWPAATATGGPARAGTTAYAGLHSHDDGLIHAEAQTSDEAGASATLGRYFQFGGWGVSESHIDFLGVEKNNGDACGDAEGVVRWSVNGKEQNGNPASYHLEDQDVVALAFVPEDVDLADLGDPPSKENLQNPNAGEGHNVTPSSTETTAPTDTTGPTETTAPTETTVGTETSVPDTATTAPGVATTVAP